jgi:hypothetical protein
VTILLDALAAMELLVKKEGSYSCPPGDHFLLSEKGSRINLFYGSPHGPCLAEVVELDRKGQRPGRARKPMESQETNQITAFIGAMTRLRQVGPRIVAAVNPGPGEFAGCRRRLRKPPWPFSGPSRDARPFSTNPKSFRSPETPSWKQGLDRMTLVGDFTLTNFPGHDLALISAIIHQNSLGRI